MRRSEKKPDLDVWKEILRKEKLPAVLVDLVAFDRNARAAAEMVRAGAKGQSRQTIRLATKSVRVPGLIQRVLASDPIFKGLMCFSALEAKALATAGIDDFLIAYPTFQSADLGALKELHLAGKKVRLVVDSIDGLRRVSEFMGTLPKPFSLVLDVDMSLRFFGFIHLGVRRSPVRSVEQVLSIFENAKKFSNLKLCGVMGYEAQVAGLPDRNPFKKLITPVVHWVRKRSVVKIARKRAKIYKLLQEKGYALEIFNGGGTGSLNFSVQEPWLTEVTMGSGLLQSHLFDYYSNIRFEPACFFALQMVRRSDPGYLTCQGGGYIASGEPGWDRLPIPVGPGDFRLVTAEGCGEVQTPLQGRAAQSLDLGDPVFFRHAKAGELAERFNEYLLVGADLTVERAQTYRGLGWSFF